MSLTSPPGWCMSNCLYYTVDYCIFQIMITEYGPYPTLNQIQSGNTYSKLLVVLSLGPTSVNDHQWKLEAMGPRSNIAKWIGMSWIFYTLNLFIIHELECHLVICTVPLRTLLGYTKNQNFWNRRPAHLFVIKMGNSQTKRRTHFASMDPRTCARKMPTHLHQSM